MHKPLITAAELERMTPAERQACFDQAVEDGTKNPPARLLASARAFIEARIVAESRQG